MTLHRRSAVLHDISGMIHDVLVARGKRDVSERACKDYARKFIARRVPGWRPGKPLSPHDAQKVGAAFLRVVGWRIHGKHHFCGRSRPNHSQYE